MSTKSYSIYWFRRDLRLEDNAALSYATMGDLPVKCIFILDTLILEDLPKDDKRVSLLKNQLEKLKEDLQKQNSDLAVYYGNVVAVWQELLKDNLLKAVYTNTDYEPYATQRDAKVAELLANKGVLFHLLKDHVIFEKNEILTKTGNTYRVYTPYSRAWKTKLLIQDLPNYTVFPNFLPFKAAPIPTLETLGFQQTNYVDFPTTIPSVLEANYSVSRDYPALDSTSHLSIALRFGLISIRKLVRFAQNTNETFLNELIWREFFMQILWHYPKLIYSPFKQKYSVIEWRNDEEDFVKWCSGKTGYPIVDAGMRELNATGYMHNRVRMITASFLVKHLLINWQWGEAYFAEKLLDYELASNNGNWQWVAGCGTDAAPYFRVFNPETQQKKFDKDLVYVRKWVPEFGTAAYSKPIIEHKFARERCLQTYKKALSFSSE